MKLPDSVNGGLARVLGLGPDATWAESAAAFARVAGLPADLGEDERVVLTAVLVELQEQVLERPAEPFDRAEVAHTALQLGYVRAGLDVVARAAARLAPDTLDARLRPVLHSTIAPALSNLGLIRLVGG